MVGIVTGSGAFKSEFVPSHFSLLTSEGVKINIVIVRELELDVTLDHSEMH